MKRLLRTSQSGFTILELMVATVVLSVVLLISTMAIMGVNRLYYKGQNAIHTNDTARNILQDVSKQIEFGAQTPNLAASPAISPCPAAPNPALSLWCSSTAQGKVYAYCIDTTRYSFALNTQYIDGTNHVLWEDTIAPSDVTNCRPLNVFSLSAGVPQTTSGAVAGTNGKELLLPNMRLTGFEIQQNTATGAYNVTVDVVYGSDDLLTAIPPADANHPTIDLRECKSTIGDQFCAVSELQTSAMRRLE